MTVRLIVAGLLASASVIGAPVCASDQLPGGLPAAATVMAAPVPPSPEPSPAPSVPETTPPPAISADAKTHPPEASELHADEQEEVVVRRRRPKPPSFDPLERINAQSYAITQKVDEAVVAPVAGKYEKTVPMPIRNGLRNMLANLYEPIVFLNYLLQHNIGKSAETFGRFTVNTAIGMAGLFDIAKRRPFCLPLRPNGFTGTLGFYGVKSGPYLFLPLMGPTTVRDLIGDNIDRVFYPTFLGSPFNRSYYAIPVGIERGLDRRIAFDERLEAVRKHIDPYAARRTLYLQGRQDEIDALHVKNRSTPRKCG